jgi:hypothetical protein
MYTNHGKAQMNVRDFSQDSNSERVSEISHPCSSRSTQRAACLNPTLRTIRAVPNDLLQALEYS